MLFLATWFCFFCTVKSAVLDPAPYLFPNPPLTPSEIDEQNLWSQSRMQRDTDLAVIPIAQVEPISAPPSCATKPVTYTTQLPPIPNPTSTRSQPLETSTSLTLSPKIKNQDEQEVMEKAETFWPSLRTTGPYFGIHVPLTFAFTGNYGRYGTGNRGVIASSYASVSDDGDSGLFKLYGQAGLAGAGYGSYPRGTTVYGKGASSGWSGWGNGKWGHYGKG